MFIFVCNRRLFWKTSLAKRYFFATPDLLQGTLSALTLCSYWSPPQWYIASTCYIPLEDGSWLIWALVCENLRYDHVIKFIWITSQTPPHVTSRYSPLALGELISIENDRLCRDFRGDFVQGENHQQQKSCPFWPICQKKQESQSAKFKTGMFGPGRVEVGAGSVWKRSKSPEQWQSYKEIVHKWFWVSKKWSTMISERDFLQKCKCKLGSLGVQTLTPIRLRIGRCGHGPRRPCPAESALSKEVTRDELQWYKCIGIGWYW